MAMQQDPSPLGLKKSFGFGDRLGLAGPGHLEAVMNTDFAPMLAQQSIRELTRTERSPEEVMGAARRAIQAAGFQNQWGADADHLKNEADVKLMADAGYSFFTIDPSDFVNNAADSMADSELFEEVKAQHLESIYGQGTNLSDLYLGQRFEVIGNASLRFDQVSLHRAAVKYGRAIHRVDSMAHAIHQACGGRPYEIEVSVDETDAPTSPLEHLFFALELKRRGVKVISLAPRFEGAMEKGIDYKGDLLAFEAALVLHTGIAQTYGPYKISVHSGSDKFSIYPILGRVCGDLLHVKTAGTSYLEALRVVAKTNLSLFREIVAYSISRFVEDKASYHISVTDDWVLNEASRVVSDEEDVFLNQDFGRQLLHVTFGSVLTRGRQDNGRLFKDAILENLEMHPSLHREVLSQHLGKHLRLLSAG